MVYLNSTDAAGVLGVRSAVSANRILREHGVINQSRTGTVGSYLSDDVVRVLGARHREAAARHGHDLTGYAREIVRQLRPRGPETVALVDGRRVRREPGFTEAERVRLTGRAPDPLIMIGPDAVMVFGRAALVAAAAPVPATGCRWCVARIESEWGALKPDPADEAYRVLLGAKVCNGCKLALTPAKPVKRSAPVPSAVAASATPSLRKAAEWRQTAAQRRERGDAAGAAAAERNAEHWLRYGASHQGS